LSLQVAAAASPIDAAGVRYDPIRRVQRVGKFVFLFGDF
jgi:hypothetical protein